MAAATPPPGLDAGRLSVLVVDDEPPARAELAWLLQQDARVGIVRTASGGAQALRLIEQHPIDAVFSDIRMPGVDGLELARALARAPRRPHVVFVTAYDRHAVDAFDLQAIDYLMKPVRAERLAESVRRIHLAVRQAAAAQVRRPGMPMGVAARPVPPTGAPGHPGHPGHPGAAAAHQAPARPGTPPGWAPPPSALSPAAPAAASPSNGDGGRTEGQDETIAVELGGVTRFVQRSQVRFVEAQGDYARLHTNAGSHLIRIPLSTLEERWAAAGFVRIHRSTLVALPHVDEIRVESGRCSVRLGDRVLQVSRRHTKDLRDKLVRASALDRPGRPGAAGGPGLGGVSAGGPPTPALGTTTVRLGDAEQAQGVGLGRQAGRR
ncbi:MAG: response regulator transcription factor [Kineosporiaceae bacterium]